MMYFILALFFVLPISSSAYYCDYSDNLNIENSQQSILNYDFIYKGIVTCDYLSTSSIAVNFYNNSLVYSLLHSNPATIYASSSASTTGYTYYFIKDLGTLFAGTSSLGINRIRVSTNNGLISRNVYYTNSSGGTPTADFKLFFYKATTTQESIARTLTTAMGYGVLSAIVFVLFIGLIARMRYK